MLYMTIDSGTTNTRAKIWKDNTVVAQSFIEAGVRDTAITGSTQKLKKGVGEAIRKAIGEAKVANDSIAAIIASGMITSNVGLHEVPHVIAPAGKAELAAGMVQTVIPEVSDKPIWFIPGIKNHVAPIDTDNCETMDIMRGEETEIIGIIEKLCVKGPAVLILPGSHSKIAQIDEDNRITGCITTLAGELLEIITHKTILADALHNSFADTMDEAMLLKGASFSSQVGLGRTCFMIRILDLFSDLTVNEKANILLGAVLGSDLLAMKNSRALKVTAKVPLIIMGKKLLKEAFAVLLRHDSCLNGDIKVVDDDLQQDISGAGALAIARARGIIAS